MRTTKTIDELKQPEPRERVFSVQLTAMAKRPFLFWMMTALASATNAQCPNGTVYINSQADVNAFAANYPACTDLPGSLNIDGAGITDLSPFNGLTRIEGTLQLTNLSLHDINAFSTLARVGGELWISQCNSLTSLTGFTALDTVGQTLRFWDNSAMVVLDAFPDLDVCGMSLWIGGNVSLTSIHGFGELDAMGMLSITENTVLTDLGAFDHAIAIANFVELVHNEALSVCNVQALCDFGLLTDYSQDGVNANALGCQYWSQVQASCISTSIAIDGPLAIELYPNPTSGILQVEGCSDPRVPVSIMDELGRFRMGSFLQCGQLDVHLLEPGVYSLVFMVDGRPQRSRFIRY